MSKFKPGDLAMIVACRLPDLIGKTVELVHPYARARRLAMAAGSG
ncbi:hypothetical protein ACP3P8_23135 [Pseudomonas aeruginosa]